MYQMELDAVKAIKKEYGENLPPPADELEIKRFSEVFGEVFRIEIPQEYLAFLRLCNGFEFNGCIIYSCQNMVENQLDYDFLTDNYIVFAEYDKNVHHNRLRKNRDWRRGIYALYAYRRGY